jgi:hypothetical protein
MPVHVAAPLPVPRNEIRRFQAASVSDEEIEVVVDYVYVGDQGEREVFMHAAVLRTDEWASRVSGTGFPGAAVGVGSGRVTINIRKVPDTGPAISTKVRVCMVSLTRRSAFLCENFDFTKAWAPVRSAKVLSL